jgi:hypothetical protein
VKTFLLTLRNKNRPWTWHPPRDPVQLAKQVFDMATLDIDIGESLDIDIGESLDIDIGESLDIDIGESKDTVSDANMRFQCPKCTSTILVIWAPPDDTPQVVDLDLKCTCGWQDRQAVPIPVKRGTVTAINSRQQ